MNFFYKESKSKIKTATFFCFWRVGGGGGGGGGWGIE